MSMKFDNLEHEIIYNKMLEYISKHNSQIDPRHVEVQSMDELQSNCAKYIAIMDSNKENHAHKPIHSHRKILGPFIIFGKKVVRKLLKWYLNPITQQQNTFNQAVTSTTKLINESVNNLQLDVSQVVNKIQNNEEKINYINNQSEHYDSKITKIYESQGHLQISYEHLLLKMDEIEEKYTALLDNTGYDVNKVDSFFEKKTYGQAGEDSILAYIIYVLGILFEDVTYIDLGANHAKEMSNTYYFYNRGAKGVLVEANSKLLPELKLYRNRDIILNNVVDVVDEEIVNFYILSGDGLSTPDLKVAKRFCEINPHLEIVEEKPIKTITYNSIVEQYLGKAPTILSIDIEGKDLELLNSIDFENYRPLLIVVEMIEYDTKLNYRTKNKEILNFLNNKDYDEYAFTGINSIFIDRKQYIWGE
ncbi:FkbM family methyltransferase [Lysinibacillus pakistanensis]